MNAMNKYAALSDEEWVTLLVALRHLGRYYGSQGFFQHYDDAEQIRYKLYVQLSPEIERAEQDTDTRWAKILKRPAAKLYKSILARFAAPTYD